LSHHDNNGNNKPVKIVTKFGCVTPTVALQRLDLAPRDDNV